MLQAQQNILGTVVGTSAVAIGSWSWTIHTAKKTSSLNRTKGKGWNKQYAWLTRIKKTIQKQKHCIKSPPTPHTSLLWFPLGSTVATSVNQEVPRLFLGRAGHESEGPSQNDSFASPLLWSSTITPLRCSGGYHDTSGPSCPAYRPPTCGSINTKLLSIAAPWASSGCRRAKSSPPTIPHCLGPGIRNRCSNPPATELWWCHYSSVFFGAYRCRL